MVYPLPFSHPAPYVVPGTNIGARSVAELIDTAIEYVRYCAHYKAAPRFELLRVLHEIEKTHLLSAADMRRFEAVGREV